MEGEHEHEPQPAPTTTVVDAGSELVAPVVNHTEKITRIEERQAQHEQELLRQIADLESRLADASTNQANAIYERITKLEEKLEAAAAEPVEDAGAGVELTVPEIEHSPAPPEKVKQGMRYRRKSRKKGKN